MNILLIGMPGCGKSAFGKAAADSLKLEFVDTDAEIERREGVINDIFAERGEDAFRDIETNVLRECLKQDNRIISTGGGIVKRDENVDLMKQAKAYVIFIDRPIELIAGDIDTSGRPLLKDNAERLKTLYAERYDKYRAAANAMVINDGTFSAALGEIMRLIKNAI